MGRKAFLFLYFIATSSVLSPASKMNDRFNQIIATNPY